jgi:hypothetical protein
VHFSKVTQGLFDQNKLVRVAQPTCSSDLALSHFWYIAHLKSSLVGCTFNEPNELLEVISAILEEVLRDKMGGAFMDRKVKSVINSSGSCVRG